MKLEEEEEDESEEEYFLVEGKCDEELIQIEEESGVSAKRL